MMSLGAELKSYVKSLIDVELGLREKLTDLHIYLQYYYSGLEK